MTQEYQWLLRREAVAAQLSTNSTIFNNLTRLLLILRTPNGGILYSHAYISKLVDFLQENQLPATLDSCRRFRSRSIADEVIGEELPLLKRRLNSRSDGGRITAQQVADVLCIGRSTAIRWSQSDLAFEEGSNDLDTSKLLLACCWEIPRYQ